MEQLSKLHEHFIKNYDENNDKGYILEVGVEYPKNLFNLHCDLPFLLQRKKIEKCKKLVWNIHNKKKLCCTHKSLKTSIKSWINTKKSTQSNSV